LYWLCTDCLLPFLADDSHGSQFGPVKVNKVASMSLIRVERRSGNNFIRFRYAGVSYNRSLKTKDRREAIDWLVTDRKVTETLNREQPIPLSVCNEAAIGFAFAVIKMCAICTAEVIERGLAALARTAILVEGSRLADEVEAQWGVAIGKMQAKLEALRKQS